MQSAEFYAEQALSLLQGDGEAEGETQSIDAAMRLTEAAVWSNLAIAALFQKFFEKTSSVL